MTVTKVLLEDEPEDVVEPEHSQVLIDLGLLCVFDPSPMSDDSPKSLLLASQENVQKLINKIIQQPILKTDQAEKLRGRIYDLPKPTTEFPREKPVPKPKPLTKWERFKKARGLNTRKKDKLAYDEMSGTWKMRYGHDRANDPLKAPIMEAPDDWQPGDPDPFTQLRAEKRERVTHNKEKNTQNLIEARGLRAPGSIHLGSAIGYSSKKKPGVGKPVKTDPLAHVDLALKIAQHTTRSMGKYDPLLRGEEVPSMKAEKTRAQLSAKDEIDRNLDLLNMVVGKTTKKKVKFDKEKAARLEKQKKENKRARKNKAVGGRSKKRRGSYSAHSALKKAKR